jgi:hypothetical protein
MTRVLQQGRRSPILKIIMYGHKCSILRKRTGESKGSKGDKRRGSPPDMKEGHKS